MEFIYRNIKGDRVIWIVVFFLLIFSILAVYSSINTLAYKHQAGNQFHYLIKHASFILGGVGLMYWVHKIKYTFFSRLSIIAFYVSIPLLIATLLVGKNLNDANRWLAIPGTPISFQTSDFAKIALLMFLARQLSVNYDKLVDAKSTFLYVMLPVVVTCGLILPANFSTSALVFSTSLIMMFVGRVKLKYLGGFIGLGITGILLILLIGKTAPKVFPRFGTWMKRIENFSNDNKGGDNKGNYQIEQAKIAIAIGYISGQGPGKSTQRNFLPHPYSDFIYAFIIEEYGLIGGCIMVLLYLVLLFRGVRIATRCDKNFGSLLAFGICFSIVFQAFINMAVASNLFPVTGQPLPLVSMGGTSMWFSCIAIGIVLSISKDVESKSPEDVVASA